MQRADSFSINENLQECRERAKRIVKPSSSRCKYRSVYEWSKSQLVRFSKMIEKCEQSQVEAKLLEEEKKVILSMLLEIGRLTKQECAEKGLLIEQMLHYAMGFLNQHQKYYDMLSYRQIKHFQESINDIEKEYQQNSVELKQQLDALRKDKQHRWRNIFMVVKDNRVLRRQKAKLMQKHREEIWRIRQLEEDLINLRSQNQKYKIMFDSYSSKENTLKTYVTNQLLLMKLDEKVKQYPGRARRLLKKQLIDLQINELNSLQHKMKFIIQSMEQNNEVCLQFDDWCQNVETTRLFYNVSVQTYVQTQTVGMNTITPIVPTKTLHSIKVQARPRDFVYLQDKSKVIDLKISCQSKKSTIEKKRTGHQSFMNISVSKYKKRVSISSNNSQYNLTNDLLLTKRNQLRSDEKMRVQQVMNIKLIGFKNTKKINKNFSSIAINISDITNLLPSDQELNQTDLDDKFKNNKIDTSKNIKHSPKQNIRKKENFTKKAQSLTQNICFDIRSKRLTNKTLNRQIYQLSYKPMEGSKNKSPQISQKNSNDSSFLKQNDKKKQQISFQLILSEKQSIKKLENENINSLLKNKTFMNFVQQKIKKQKPFNESFRKHFFKHQPIIQVLESASNRSLQTLQERQSDHIYENKNCQLRKNEGTQVKISSLSQNIMVNKVQKFIQAKQQKKKLQMNGVRHRRQHTQNIEIKKPKENEKKFQLQQISNRISRSKQLEFDRQTTKNSGQTISYKNSSQKQNRQLIMKKLEVKTQANQTDVKTKLVDDRYLINGQKLLQKLMHSLFCRRKEIMNTPQNLRSFTNNFLISLFGCKSTSLTNKIKPLQKFYATIKDLHKKKKNQMYFGLFLEKLIPIRGYELFTQDILVLFAIMLEKLSSLGVLQGIMNVFTVPKQYGMKVIEYLCSIYLSPEQTIAFIKYKIHPNQQDHNINMMDSFLVFANELENIIFNSQLWQFFNSISSSSTQFLSECQIYQIIMPTCFLSVSNECHKQRISLYASKQLPIHRLCMYAYRYNWNQIYNIKSWVNETYLEYFGVFCFTNPQLIDFCNKIQFSFKQTEKFRFLSKIFKEMRFRHQILKTPLDQNFLKLCRLALIFNNIQKKEIFPQNLLLVQEAYRKQLRKACLNKKQKQ